MSKYNGWANKETWLVNLHYGEVIQESFIDNSDLTGDDLREIVNEYIHDHNGEIILACGLISDFISTSMSEVDWCELAETHRRFEV
jgi:hypothetical protein